VLGYYLRLALASLQRSPVLTAITVVAIAVGISTCIITLTIYHASARNPIWWKSDRLYAVTIDSWDPHRPYDAKHPDLPPPQLSYRDVVYLLDSTIPRHKVAMFRSQDVLSAWSPLARPTPVFTRVTTADFFATFDVPFLYGSGWSAAADRNLEPVLVLSREQNDLLFGGGNSVGRTLRWNDSEFRVVGVLDTWRALPKFYDLTRGPFEAPEDAYVPFGWARTMGRFPNGGRFDCWQDDPINTFEEFMRSDCVWLQMWVELPNAASQQRMQVLLDTYWTEQHNSGRFPRERNNRITNVGQWLVDQGVVSNDSRILVAVAAAFLTVCLLNSVGILLSKFVRGAGNVSVRRALGARKWDIVLQHLVEAGLLCGVASLLGLGLATLGIWAVQSVYAHGEIGSGGYHQIIRFERISALWALLLAAIAAVGAGLYPAWRISRVPPASYLKAQ
jgi:putative ABC transport system permease protein